ncbi:MAG TPA: Gldg family protein, partial [Chitinophaga sp.]
IPGLGQFSTADEIADKVAANLDISKRSFLSPEQIDKMIDLAPEEYLTVRRLTYQGKSSYLRFMLSDNNPIPGEAEVMAALKRLLVKYPKVAFLAGNNERGVNFKGDREYQVIGSKRTTRQSLINKGFDVISVDLTGENIPADVDIAVLGDPMIPLGEQERQKITAFINKGGNMIITGEPGRQAILNPVLQPLGISLKPGVLIKPDVNVTPGFMNGIVTKYAGSLDSNLARIYNRQGTVAMQGAAAIDYTAPGPFTVHPLLLSGPGGWNKATYEEPSILDLAPDTLHGDQVGEFPIAVALTRQAGGRQQRIFVSGDADFISNGEFSRTARGYNQYFFEGIARWLTYGSFPVDVNRPPYKDNMIHISKNTIEVLNYVCKGIIPGIIAVLGLILLFRRRMN